MLFKHLFHFWTAINGVKFSTYALIYNLDQFNSNERNGIRTNWSDMILVCKVSDDLFNLKFNDF